MDMLLLGVVKLTMRACVVVGKAYHQTNHCLDRSWKMLPKLMPEALAVLVQVAG